MLRLQAISTEYEGVPVLRRVSMKIEQGELVCLLGSNGSGKSTTLRAIIRLIPIIEGAIFFEGVPIHRWKTHRIIGAGLSAVLEGRRLFPKMTVLENLRIGAFGENDGGEISRRLQMVFEIFPRLKERLRQLAGTLSGGEQAMVAISRGMMANPRILLMDEPSLGLSPVLVDEFFSAICGINQNGTTILLIEQNARKALSISSHAYVLQKGEIIVQGTGEDLCDNEIIKSAYFKTVRISKKRA